jgi:DNA-binding NtrC family response regulator
VFLNDKKMQTTAACSNNNAVTILIVNNDELTLDSFMQLLVADGYQLHTATGHAESISKVSNGVRPNIIIADYCVRGKSGIEVIKSIRNFLGEEIPAIIITDDGSVKARRDIRRSKCIFLRRRQETYTLVYQVNKMFA